MQLCISDVDDDDDVFASFGPYRSASPRKYFQASTCSPRLLSPAAVVRLNQVMSGHVVLQWHRTAAVAVACLLSVYCN